MTFGPLLGDMKKEGIITVILDRMSIILNYTNYKKELGLRFKSYGADHLKPLVISKSLNSLFLITYCLTLQEVAK